MKTSQLHTVFMNVPESAGFKDGENIIEVFVDKGDADEMALELRKKVAERWKWDINNLEKYDQDLLNNTVEVIKLSDAIDRIKDDCFDRGMWTATPGEEY